MSRIVTLALVALLVSATLLAADTSDKTLKAATFCQGTYALCIKAPCEPIVTKNSNGSFSITEANCSCDVVKGWSMGPGACDKREPVTSGGRTFLISTYSNLYNLQEKTLTCDSPNTVWAWCYGSPCVVDEKNSSKAVCTCPVKTGKALTLGGSCRKTACREIWSAATPANDAFANDYFFKYAKEHNLMPPPLPPAQDCPAGPGSK